MPAPPLSPAAPPRSQPPRLPPNLFLTAADGGKLLDNLCRFARLLRRMGVPAGPDKIRDAALALEKTGLHSRADVFWALFSVFVCAPGQRESFARAFQLFWRAADPLEEAPDILSGGDKTPEKNPPAARRAMEAFGEPGATTRGPPALQADASRTADAAAVSREKDFEQMSAAEWRAAAAIAAQTAAALPPIPTRRRRAAVRGAWDLRRMTRTAMRKGGVPTRAMFCRRRVRPPSVVALLDISGSMAAYSRILVHFIAGMAAGGLEVRAFLFGAELHPAARKLGGDLDSAVERIANSSRDWGGGTRLTASLRTFNRAWLRRTLAGGATVLLATDGLERGGDIQDLENEIGRLARSARRLWWLNPLLRWEKYAALARGAKILARQADAILPIHNIQSLEDLGAALAQNPPRRRRSQTSPPPL